MRVLRLEVPEASVEPRPPRPCPSCWTGFASVEPAVMPAMAPAAQCPCPFFKQPPHRLLGEEPQPCLSVLKTSRSLGPAPASSNPPRLFCHVPPALAPSLTLSHLLPPPHLEPNSPASAPVKPFPRFPHCRASRRWRHPSLLAITLPPCPSRRRTRRNPFARFPLQSNALLNHYDAACWRIWTQRMEPRALWVQNPWFSKTAGLLGTVETTLRPTSYPPSGELSPPAASPARSEGAEGR